MATKKIIAPVFSAAGQKSGEVELASSVFGVAVNEHALWQAVRTQNANARQVLAHTKTKGEVRGGGKKPWKQKGTGRARHGSTRNPQWVGGGVAFGPRKDRNFTLKINKKAKQAALRMALSDRAANEAVFVIEGLESLEGKTAALKKCLTALPMTLRNVVLVVPKGMKNIRLASRNMNALSVKDASSLDVVSVLNSRTLVVAKESLDVISEVFSPKKK